MTIDEFLRDQHSLPEPSVPFLTENDALWDSVLVSLRLDLVRNRGELLIHGTGLPAEYNTAVILMHGVQDLKVSTPYAEMRTLRTIHLWRPALRDGLWTVETSTESTDPTSKHGGELSVAAHAAEIILGTVAVADAALPDFELATDDEVAAGMVAWTSEFTPLARELAGSVAAT